MSCGNITIGSNPDCENLPESGTRARLILMNYDDVETIFYSDEGKVTSIVMQDGKEGYEFLGFRNDVKKDEQVFKTKRKNRFKHSLSFVIYENDQLQKNNIKKITRGRFLAIIENKGKDDDSIELLGRNVGLRIVGGVIRNAYARGGLFVINLATPDNRAEFETKLPQTVGSTYENGLEIIDSVLNPVVIFRRVDTADSDLRITYTGDIRIIAQ